MAHRHILFGGVGATGFMTAYTGGASLVTGQELNPPEILASVLGRKSKATVPGWLAHFACGCGWAIVYHECYAKRLVSPTLPDAAFLGLFSGSIAIRSWTSLFNAFSKPHAVRRNLFMRNLVVGHLVYGIAVTVLLRRFL